MSNYMGVPVALAIVASMACGNTMRGMTADTENAADKIAAGVETMDVRAALIADGPVDAANRRASHGVVETLWGRGRGRPATACRSVR